MQKNTFSTEMIRRFIIMVILLVSTIISGQAIDRALLVGIGKYDRMGTGWNEIHGDNDIALLKPLLQKHGFKDIVTLINTDATKTAITSELKSLAARCKRGDKVYFHFSGHGQPIRDDNHDEIERYQSGSEKKRDSNEGDRRVSQKQYDESIIPYDACRDSRKMGGRYVGQNHLIDDELCPLLDAIKKKLGKEGELFVVVDACYSKGIQKDEMTDIDPELLRYVRGTNYAFTPPGHSSYLARVPKPNRFTPGAKMTVVTACGDKERNFEYKANSNKMYGSLSFYISILLKTDADFNRWRKCFTEKRYKGRGIIQSIQHPTIEIYP